MVALATLMLEVLLTRITSVMAWYHLTIEKPVTRPPFFWGVGTNAPDALLSPVAQREMAIDSVAGTVMTELGAGRAGDAGGGRGVLRRVAAGDAAARPPPLSNLAPIARVYFKA